MMTERRNPRLDLFAARCRELALQVNSSAITFIDAVDMAYLVSVWSGLVGR